MNAVIYRLDFDCGDGRVYSYWGSSVDFKKRMRQHRSDLRKGRHGNERMQRVYDKYGDFRESIVMLCGREELAENERCMIVRHYGQDYCTNLTKETVSVMRDPEVQQRQAEAMRAVKQTEEYQAAHKAAMEKRSQDPEWRAAMAKLERDPEFQKKRAAATREACSKAVQLTMPDGEVCVFPSVVVAAGKVGVSKRVLGNWLRGERPWPGQGQRLLKKFAHLEGLTGRYIE